MLHDRKELVEREIKKLYKSAATMYLHIVTTNGDIHSKEYQDLKERISDLEYDLSMINKLIEDGYD